MALTYTYFYPPVQVSDFGDLVNVVTNVQYKVTVTDGDRFYDYYGEIQPPKTTEPFIEFENLTEEIIKSWIYDSHSKTQEEFHADLKDKFHAKYSKSVPPSW